MRKQLIAVGLTAASVTSLVGVGVASAASETSSSKPMSSLVQAIATKFNLKTADVQAVFEEQHTKMKADREAEVKKEVAQLVTDGKITQEQADKINAKRAEIRAEREATKDSGSTRTRDEMKAKMNAKRAELETWAKDNGIDTAYLRYVMGGRGHGGFHGGSEANTVTAS